MRHSFFVALLIFSSFSFAAANSDIVGTWNLSEAGCYLADNTYSNLVQQGPLTTFTQSNSDRVILTFSDTVVGSSPLGPKREFQILVNPVTGNSFAAFRGEYIISGMGDYSPGASSVLMDTTYELHNDAAMAPWVAFFGHINSNLLFSPSGDKMVLQDFKLDLDAERTPAPCAPNEKLNLTFTKNL